MPRPSPSTPRRGPVHDLHVSNLVSYLSLAMAVGAIAAAGGPHGRFIAGALIALSAILDTFDGKFARRFTRTPRQARLGAELDSLVDAMVFGLTPIVVVARLAQPTSGAAEYAMWAAAAAYAIAAATRLTFFNVEADADRFVGLPTPAAGLVWSTALLFPLTDGVAAWILLATAALMIAPIGFPRPRGMTLGFFVLWAVGLVAAHLAFLMSSSHKSGIM